MFQKLLKQLQSPHLFASGTDTMWDNPYISQQMLQAHLNPDIDAASRNIIFMKKSIDWINRLIGNNKRILDLGCGPGLYASELANKGHDLVGVDFSKCSIDYATKKAIEKGLKINYKHQNYLNLKENNSFDLVLLIYCDFGVLSFDQQTLLLQKIHNALKPNGLLIFDVYSDVYLNNFVELKSWKQEAKGFWRPNPYVVLNEKKKHEEALVILEQYTVFEQDSIDCYRIWNTCYKQNQITKILENHGFSQLEFYSDVTGKEYANTSKTIGIMAKKT